MTAHILVEQLLVQWVTALRQTNNPWNDYAAKALEAFGTLLLSEMDRLPGDSPREPSLDELQRLAFIRALNAEARFGNALARYQEEINAQTWPPDQPAP